VPHEPLAVECKFNDASKSLCHPCSGLACGPRPLVCASFLRGGVRSEQSAHAEWNDHGIGAVNPHAMFHIVIKTEDGNVTEDLDRFKNPPVSDFEIGAP